MLSGHTLKDPDETETPLKISHFKMRESKKTNAA
jgi:hypothetical protein